MPKTVSKLNQHAARSRLTQLDKRKLLPLSKEAVDAMAMQYHTALVALQARQGAEHGVMILLQMVVVAGFIGEATAVKIDPAVLGELESALNAALERGQATEEWFLDAQAHDLCAALLAEHERQLRVTPLATLQEVLARVKRFAKGERYGSSRG
ncbi:Fis family transcriptional regulator (plasmid) [Burkholderia gladioli pv. alliicola]|uniref:Fis family transcriptional regulator n=1 Tax=Burkholderia gladioli TaxID=28095 RepID=A0A2A7SBK0_BURGA|nr:Fis family transcriptional regulator [Burkholderia gladioli]PEH40600.1 Fis family transcriptional regulator [Burkholderia gladioli]